jgi:AraC-like DNA-binding protein
MEKTGEAARYWTTPLLPGGELLAATFREQRFCRHWHDSYAIAVIVRGAQGYWYRGARRTSPAGSFDVINPGEVHTGEAAALTGWAYRAFYPTVEWIRQVTTSLADAPTAQPSFPDDPIADPEVGQRLVFAHVLLETNVDPLRAETALVAAFSLLLSRHATDHPSAKVGAPDAGRVSRMQERLRADLTGALSLTALAAVVGLSPFHAARLFTKTVGMPPHAWRNQQRVNRAFQCLRSGTSVAEAAAVAGFFDQSHLTRHFKRVYGVPPATLATALHP